MPVSSLRPHIIGYLFPIVALVACQGSDSTGDASSTSLMSTGSSSSDETPTSSSTTQGTSTSDGFSSTGTTNTSSTSIDTTGSLSPCGECPLAFKCRYNECVPDLGTCTNNDDCPGDSYCDADGECIPYGVPPEKFNDPECVKQDVPDGVAPVVQCEWTGVSDPNDPTKGSARIYTTPIVADLNLDKDPDKLQPSIIVSTFASLGQLDRIGTLRVFDGRTCTEQLRAGGADDANDDDRPAYAVPWAVGDLDNDLAAGGHPELVSYHRMPSDNNIAPVSLYAFGIVFNDDIPDVERLWYGRDCDTDTVLTFSLDQDILNGPMLHDLDDDDYPEIIVGENVFDQNGCLLTKWDPANADQMPVIADVDLDGIPDLVSQRRFAGWDIGVSEWVDKPQFIPDNGDFNHVHLGLADFGLYSVGDGRGLDALPEMAVLTIENFVGSLRIQKLQGGAPVWGPIEVYKTGNPDSNQGGPLTISDFDGDGQPELASAGATHYAVYDPDCVEALMGESPVERPGGTCERAPEQEAKNLPDGVLWVQPSQDLSSNITGSSIFDFNGDGAAEAVYRDECFLRVYDGKSGSVLFGAPASSGTGMEYPSIADVDGDFATEIIVPRTDYNGDCPAKDPLFPESETFVAKNGFVIYRDPLDRWANSRPVWNQHAYFVTHVEDQARIPRASEAPKNWQVPGLNNLRQNTQGSAGKLQIADLTVELQDLGTLCDFRGGNTSLAAEVCNRGTNPVVDGVVVQFLETMTPDQNVDQAVDVCETKTTKLLLPGDCETVSCDALLMGGGNVYVDVDPEDLIADCHPGNNLGADALGLCPG